MPRLARRLLPRSPSPPAKTMARSSAPSPSGPPRCSSSETSSDRPSSSPPARWSRRLPSASLVLAAWFAGGLMACAGGLTFAEMGAMLPRSGGVYVFLDEAYGPLVAFLFGWTMVLIVLPGGTAAVAVGFAESFSYFVPVARRPHASLATIPAAARRAEHLGRAGRGRALDRGARRRRTGSASRAASRIGCARDTAQDRRGRRRSPSWRIAAWPHTPALTPDRAPRRAAARSVRRRDDRGDVGL